MRCQIHHDSVVDYSQQAVVPEMDANKSGAKRMSTADFADDTDKKLRIEFLSLIIRVMPGLEFLFLRRNPATLPQPYDPIRVHSLDSRAASTLIGLRSKTSLNPSQ
jgi:hypothetical protein